MDPASRCCSSTAHTSPPPCGHSWTSRRSAVPVDPLPPSRVRRLRPSTRADVHRLQADDAAVVLDGLGVDRTHVVGHSLGAVIALELAARQPTQVLSLSLLEPAVLTGPAGAIFGEQVAPLVELYGNADPTAAVDGFLALVARPGWQETIEASVPGGVAQARADAATFFEVELPAVAAWTFGSDRAAAITCPVLSVLGTDSAPLFIEGREHLHSWFHECHNADIASVTHLLQMEQPRQVATAIAAHCAAVVAATR